MCPQRDLSASEIGKREILPVIAMRVREDHGVDGIPGEGDLRESCGQNLGMETTINEQPETASFEQRGVPAASARQNCEPSGHRVRFPESRLMK